METIKDLEKEIERIEYFKKDLTKEQWLHSQLRLNLIKARAKLQTLKDVLKVFDDLKEIIERLGVQLSEDNETKYIGVDLVKYEINSMKRRITGEAVNHDLNEKEKGK